MIQFLPSSLEMLAWRDPYGQALRPWLSSSQQSSVIQVSHLGSGSSSGATTANAVWSRDKPLWSPAKIVDLSQINDCRSELLRFVSVCYAAMYSIKILEPGSEKLT